MAGKLVMLCAEAIAKDCSEMGHFCLRTLLESVIPASVLLVALSSVPLNRLIQLEEDYPEHFTVIRKQWKELCKKCAIKHVPFRMKFQGALKNPDDGLGYKAFLSNAYFQEVLDACSVAATTDRRSAKAPRVSSLYILQGALGRSRHNISDEKMLDILAEHITELTLSSKYILQLRQLIQSNEKCMGRLKTLKLDSCTDYTSNIKTVDWTYCIERILQRSPIQTMSITSCCTILNNLLSFCVKGRWDDKAKSSLCQDNAILGFESDVNDSHDSDEVSDFSLYNNMAGDEAASEYARIKELILLKCSKHNWEERRRTYCSGLERLDSLERLTVCCNSSKKQTNKFLRAITKLLKCGSSQLKYLYVDRAVWGMKEFEELGLCLNAANDLKKEVLFTKCNWDDSGLAFNAEEAFLSSNCSKFSKSTISSLTYSDMLLDHLLALESFRHVPLFSLFLKVYNPEYFNIYCNEMSFPLPNYSLQDSPTSSEGTNLRRLTVVLNSCSSDVHLERLELLHAMLCIVHLILKERSKEVDLHAFYAGEKPCDIDYSLFKTVKMILLKFVTEI